MSTIKARGIVIKEKGMGESNKQLTLFAKDLGKIIISARGAKNVKSKFHSLAQLFCYGDFVLYKGKDFLAVTEASFITNFSVFYNELDKIAYGSYFLELIDKTIMISQEANDILLLLLKSLQMLKNAEKPRNISAAFQVKLLDLLGFRLTPNICTLCGERAVKMYFSAHDGFVCGCERNGDFLVSDDIIRAVNFISNEKTIAEGYHKIFMFTASDVLIKELHRICECTFKNQLEIDTNSLMLL